MPGDNSQKRLLSGTKGMKSIFRCFFWYGRMVGMNDYLMEVRYAGDMAGRVLRVFGSFQN